jgi:hypothetical protein
MIHSCACVHFEQVDQVNLLRPVEKMTMNWMHGPTIFPPRGILMKDQKDQKDRPDTTTPIEMDLYSATLLM